MVNQVMDFITSYDKEVGEAIQAECARQRRNLELIASENIVSEPVMMAMGTVLTNKYAEGYSGKRYYGGPASAWMWWRHLQLSAQRRFLDATTPMYSHTQEHRQIWPYLSPC